MTQSQVDVSATVGSAQTAGVEALLIRPISPDDKEVFLDAYERLGEESRYHRFLILRGRLTANELRNFTEVDHRDHEALLAIDLETRQGVGVARYVRSKEDPGVAELAVAVVDDWQRRGVGTRLAAALAERAREEGISGFSALVFEDNRPALRLLADLGRVRVLYRGQGTVALTVDLPKLASDTSVLAEGTNRPLAAKAWAIPKHAAS